MDLDHVCLQYCCIFNSNTFKYEQLNNCCLLYISLLLLVL